MSTFIRLALVALCLCCGVACDGPPEPRETIAELRVLAIQADPPEAKPGAEVKLAALAAISPDATITYQWYLCADVDTQTAEQGCDTSGTKLDAKEGASFKVPDDYLKNLSPDESFRGKYLYATLVIQSGEAKVIAVKRIVITDNPTNTNPSIDKVNLAPETGGPLTAPFQLSLDSKYKLDVTLGTGALQSYETIDASGQKQTIQETLFLSWYLTEGSLSKGYLTKETERSNIWQTPKEKPTSTTARVFVIARDGRGGTSWTTLEATLPN